MCGRYALSADPDELIEIFEVEQLHDDDGQSRPAGAVAPAPGWLAPHYNIAPTQTVPGIVQASSPGRPRSLVGMRWGLVPSWSKGPGAGPALINARLETATEKPSFRAAAAKRRCLLPADGYYEWYQPEPGAPSGGRAVKAIKQPYFIHPTDSSVMAMAGLFEFWRAPGGEWLVSCTILTCSAIDELGHLHDRMPVQVAPCNWPAWLDRELTDSRAALQLAHVPDAGEMSAYRVGAEVNKVAHDYPGLITAVDDPAGQPSDEPVGTPPAGAPPRGEPNAPTE
ncbi:Putative SOS response-associated peptidase YedK [Propionibacterium cyclohexanicum]|uniref:Abasic site processing protein n=1 Tax=Propionibacterium cyclohexanicum TaxID=64702 RepID=A0A1H9R0S4_9ACTN|nr:SOS response-associated peptidase [Propionibacterium cyclohexanicum]SER65669.1 Putative SOS response-associated peptidase YedK [Propionibacterium cyclohexanicum]